MSPLPGPDRGTDRKALRETFRLAYVIAHDEEILPLKTALEREGFEVRVVRGPYPAGSEGWSPNNLCLANHRNAWEAICRSREPAIVVEADFVPVRGFGGLQAVFDDRLAPRSLGYLYACGPQLWDLRGGLRGHAGSTVAYCTGPEVAERLIEFADNEILAHGADRYSGWDSKLGFWLNERGMETYLPYRHYGEHGGLPNPEHHRAGLRREHRADVLAGPLAFLPAYADSSRLRLLWIRSKARLWGWARLAAGRYLAWVDLKRSPERSRLLRTALGRQVLLRPPRA